MLHEQTAAPEVAASADAADEAQKPRGQRSGESTIDMLRRWADPIKTLNVAVDLTEETLDKIGQQAMQEFGIDERSRESWLKKSKDAIKLAMQVAETKTIPWQNCCYSLDTEILTADGWKLVGDVKVGDKVYSRASDGSADFFPVSKTFRHTATHVVHFEGKSIDLLVTPNHRMLVETDYLTYKNGKKYTPNRRYRRRTGTAFIGETSFIEAGEFLTKRLDSHYIPTTSTWRGAAPDKIFGIDALAYVRFLGWYISEGWAYRTQNNIYKNKDGKLVDYGPTTSSFGIAQSKKANPAKWKLLKDDIAACGFSFSEKPTGFIVHSRSMPEMMKRELRSLGTSEMKRIPNHVLTLKPELLAELLDRLVAGDGSTRERVGRQIHRSYYTTSRLLADQVQEVCQKIGMRATVSVREARMGGVIRGHQVNAGRRGYNVSINRKPRIKVARLRRRLEVYGKDVACVEVYPHHTVYVRRNGKALWCGNSNVIFPLLTVAAIQFNARAYPAIVPSRNVVKGEVIGPDDGEPMIDPQSGQQLVDPRTNMPAWKVPPGAKRERADRIGDHMSWQYLREQPEWEEDTDRLLLVLPIVGCCFRKSYFAHDLGRNASTLIANPERIVVNYWAKSMETAPRISEVVEYYPDEVEAMIRSEQFLKKDYIALSNRGEDTLAPVLFVEQHRLIDLDEDGYPEPYIVTYHKETGKVARVVANFEADSIMVDGDEVLNIRREHYYTKFDFIPNPDGGIYGVGFGQLLSPINRAVNSVINMLIDSGSQQIQGGGFIGAGFSQHSGTMRRRMGEWKFVNAPGGAIRDSIVPLEHPEPSQVLFALLGMLVEAGKEIASVKDVLTGGTPAQAMTQPTTLLALIEQGLKVFTAIFKRVYRSLKSEFEKQYRLNLIYLNDETSYQVGDEWRTITREDYKIGAGVAPAADPTMVSDMQRMAHAQFLMGYQNDPFHDPIEIRRRVHMAAGTHGISKVLNEQPAPDPKLIAQAAELEMKAQSQRTTQLKDMAQAVLYIAQADKAAGATDIGWAQHQLEVIKVLAENLTGEPSDGQPQPGQPPDERPPAPGAKKAPDGFWYLDDANRPGKYVRVLPSQPAA